MLEPADCTPICTILDSSLYKTGTGSGSICQGLKEPRSPWGSGIQPVLGVHLSTLQFEGDDGLCELLHTDFLPKDATAPVVTASRNYIRYSRPAYMRPLALGAHSFRLIIFERLHQVQWVSEYDNMRAARGQRDPTHHQKARRIHVAGKLCVLPYNSTHRNSVTLIAFLDESIPLQVGPRFGESRWWATNSCCPQALNT